MLNRLLAWFRLNGSKIGTYSEFEDCWLGYYGKPIYEPPAMIEAAKQQIIDRDGTINEIRNLYGLPSLIQFERPYSSCGTEIASDKPQ